MEDERSDETFRRELRKKMREGLNDLQRQSETAQPAWLLAILYTRCCIKSISCLPCRESG